MNILEKIVAHKKQEVATAEQAISVNELEKSEYFERTPYSLVSSIHDADKSGVIAEFKRKSPSKGIIHSDPSVEAITKGYVAAGASGLSVLTDQTFFGGSEEDLRTARALNSCPILRKDFIISEYQIVEAKAMGADVVLLIAAILTKKEIEAFASLAKELGMESLLEVHSREELHASLSDQVDLLGVNNRNLKTFTTSIQTSIDLVDQIPDQFVKVTESGLHTPQVVKELRACGYQGFLIGERFMAQAEPERAAMDFMTQLK